MTTESESITELPMIVWLKGDEEYFNEFCLDADSVMAQLQIKRSRLTQISGKELRVGKARIDRYIRPVYRPEDVQNYISWSRAPITKMKTTTELQEVTEQLEKKFTSLLIDNQPKQNSTSATSSSPDTVNTRELVKLKKEVIDVFQKILRKVDRNNAQRLQTLLNSLQHLENKVQHLDTLAQSLPYIIEQLQGIKACESETTIKKRPFFAAPKPYFSIKQMRTQKRPTTFVSYKKSDTLGR